VAYVEPDGMAYPAATTQSNATWGLDRIDQRGLPLNGTYTYDKTGSGVRAYVIDSGIAPHAEFVSRLGTGTSFVPGKSTDTTDCNGHGTHVAGTIGGAKYGVAKAVTLVPVRVFDCTGGAAWSTVMAAVDWVTANALKPAVANMSLTGGGYEPLDTAVRNSIASGVTYSLAAGNGNQAGKAQDACNYSPARVTEGLTIGATNNTDAKASFSNYGTCVDFFAPGVSITSAWWDGTAKTISGTSMAAPHVAGAAALYLQGNTTATAAEVNTALSAATTKGVVSSARTATNDLLFVGTDAPPADDTGAEDPPSTGDDPPSSDDPPPCTPRGKSGNCK
jgi:subtilisin family serine protease